MQHHKYSLTEIENMMPWERDIYVDMLITWIKEQNEKQKQKQGVSGQPLQVKRRRSGAYRHLYPGFFLQHTP